jgi:hypothetical protein
MDMNAKPTVTVLFVFSFNCLLPFNIQANIRAGKNLRFSRKMPAALIGGQEKLFAALKILFHAIISNKRYLFKHSLK